MTLCIDAHENRDVAVFDVPGAYLNAYMPDDKFLLIKFSDKFVDIMCDVNPELVEDVRIENGKKVLYLRIVKALYGCIESALLWYNLFLDKLTKLGFKVNEYDRCVANKMINGKQCTIVWYVDDVKVSYIDEIVISDIITYMQKEFGNLTITRGKKHQYLGMDIEFCKNNKVAISMFKHINEALEMVSGGVKGTTTTPAKKNLFDVDCESQLLDEDWGDIFHSVVAKLLWIAKRGRPDLELSISFLCTRVATPNIDDWQKLERVLTYLSCTKDERRIIGINNISVMNTYIDASYAVHPNMRGHTGGVISFGHGIVHIKASEQKINVKSSTECELVGLSEYVPYSLWLGYFLEEQGYKLKSNLIHQDNQSAMKMEVNGRTSCTGNSRHVNIRYFFIKDRVDKGEVDITYCPTGQMLADFFTKPLQGSLFKKFKSVIMGWTDIDTLKVL